MKTLTQGQLLKGRYLEPYRSKKGKIKGLTLQMGSTTHIVKLPKYLRPMLIRELKPEMFVQIWAYSDQDIWRAINVLPLDAAEASQLQHQWQDLIPIPMAVPGASSQSSGQPAGAEKACIQVCRKGKCYKQGSKQIWHALQSEVEANPDLQHIAIEATGCMKACKKGPNLKVLPHGKMLSGVTPDQALNVLAKCQ